MVAMPLQIPHPNAPLHLYRHLLREASYLPALCSPWVTERIKSRFHTPACRYAKVPKPFIQDAHKELRYLRAANAGHFQRMLRICYMATGRLGKRRRELGTTQLAKDPPVNTESLENCIEKVATTQVAKEPPADADPPENTIKTYGTLLPDESKAEKLLKSTARRFPANHNVTVETAESQRMGPDWLDNWSTDKIKSLAESQYSRQDKDWPYQVRRLIDPKAILPQANCWGQPFKPKLARRKLQKHWASLLRSLMPPLPQGEWDMLRDLALGQANKDMWSIPPRRSVGMSVERDGEYSPASTGSVPTAAGMLAEWEWEKYATSSVRALGTPNSRRRKVLSGEEYEHPNDHSRPIGVRAYKPRFLKRSIYGKVWNAAPLMKRKPNGKYEVIWGNAVNKITQPGPKDLAFFRGFNAKGTASTPDLATK